MERKRLAATGATGTTDLSYVWAGESSQSESKHELQSSSGEQWPENKGQYEWGKR